MEVAESTVDGPFGSALKGEHYVADPGARVVRLANLGDGRYVDSDEAYVSAEYAQVLARHSVAAGDVLVASLGDDNHRPGRACLYPPEFTPGIVKADCFRVRPGKLIDGRFLMEILNSEHVIDQTRRLAQGVTRDRINLGQLRKVRVPVPPLEEQRQIAEVLDTIDETIRATERIIAKERMVRSALRDHLVAGETPEVYLGDLASYVGSGVTPTGGSESYVTEGVLFIRSQNVYADGLRLDDVAHIAPATHAAMRRSVLRPFDILFNITGASIGRCTYFPKGLGDANVNQHVCAIRLPAPEESDSVFLSCVLDSEIGRRQLRAFNAGSNREGLNYEQLRSFRVPWPERQIRANTAAVLMGADSRISKEIDSERKLRSIRRGIAADLLSGRVRTVAA